MIFLIATMVIGPGLIVNLGLKDHWHRPRPIQTQDFNGPNPFMPWYDDDGGCKKNCSFVSGEASTGFWMVAPASVLPPPWRGPAIVAAFAFGFGASLLRLCLRRPLPQRRAARRAHHAHRHRGRPPRDLAARRLRTGVAPAARAAALAAAGRTGASQEQAFEPRGGLNKGRTSNFLFLRCNAEETPWRRRRLSVGAGGGSASCSASAC